MGYGLSIVALFSRKFVVISEEEYLDIRRRREFLSEVLFIEEKFDLVVENYLEFETALLSYAARQMVRGVLNWPASRTERNQMNRRIINLLSSCRLYLDHTRHHLRIVGDSKNGISETIDAKISAQYDGSLGYRTMEALRNYVQHRGYPIHSVTYHARFLDEWKKLMYAVTPYLKIADLEEDPKFKGSVLKELKQCGEQVDIKPMIREYVEGLGSIQNEVRAQMKPLVEESDKIIRDAIERFRKTDPADESVLGLAAVRRDGRTYTDIVPLFEDPLNYRKELESKNFNLNNLAKRYVTSEIVPP